MQDKPRNFNSLDRDSEAEYLALNARTKFYDRDPYSFEYDKEAARLYLEKHIKPNLLKFNSVSERFQYLVANDYYDDVLVAKYQISDIEKLSQKAYQYQHLFPTFMGVLKFFNAYALKSFDDSQYLETYEDRVLMCALYFADGDLESAYHYLEVMMEGRFQAATPTFLNAGKKQRGEYVSCYLLRIEDNMESIARAVTTSLQLSKRGGGVSLLLTNLREYASPIKKMAGQAKGIVPVMKILEDTFSYANQLGKRQGAGAVYLHAHHPDVLLFLDTKRENADEKVRIKSLSLGLVIPNITFELAKANQKMALFSPYDIKKEYGKAMSDISITKEYYNLVNNPRIKKTYINARKLFQQIAELHFESGYPYILFDDTVNQRNPHPGRIVMSNLCSEIAQVSTPSEYASDLSFKKIGEDISCNLGSLNIDKMMKSGSQFAKAVEISVRALNHVATSSDLSSAPSVAFGNKNNRAIGLGAMNLHGFLATHEIFYNSAEAIEFVDLFFYTVAYHAYRTSNRLVKKYGKFKNFELSQYADQSYFKKYTEVAKDTYEAKLTKVKSLFATYQVKIPTQEEWKKLAQEIATSGLANSHLMAVAPTSSISYLSSCTPSLQPIVAPVEVRKEAKIGRVYVPAYQINIKNAKYYRDDAYQLGPKAIIDIAAAAQKHIDQAISLTLFVNDQATTRDLNKAYIYAFKKGCASLYYVRVRQEVLEDSENLDDNQICEVCAI